MKRFGYLALVFLLSVFFVGGVSAAEKTIFGPKTYLRTKGKPVSYSDSFPGSEKEGKIVITNGDENGKKRISSAEILVNGSLVLGPKDFNQQVDRLEVPLTLKEDNTILVKLKSAPGSFLTVQLVQDSGDTDPDDPAGGIAAVIQDVDTEDIVTDDEVSIDADGRPVVRTKIEIVFMPDATEADMNGLLSEIGGVVTSSLQGTRSIVVRIPDPEGLDALDDLIATIEAKPFVWFVSKAFVAQPGVLPDNYYDNPPDPTQWKYLDHHLAVRAHAAWNAEEAIVHVPKVLVMDWFGSGPPAPDAFNCTAIPLGFYDLALHPHGYHVLGIISARHGGAISTGIFPGTILLDVVDRQNPFIAKDSLTANNVLINSMRASDGKIVVNTSSFAYCTGSGGHCWDLAEARENAVVWIEKVRKFNLEHQVLHLTIAGNIDTPPGVDIRDAETASIYASARLLPGLTDAKGKPVANLTNTLVVENVKNTTADAYHPVEPQCLNKGSFVGGDIAGIGTDVWSFVDPGLIEDNYTGTSMAAPQVAGLAAFLWSIDSELSPQDIIAILERTARPTPVPTASSPLGSDCSDWTQPAPMIDAYAALLAVDDRSAMETGGVPEDAPVRLAILDVVDGAGNAGTNGRFDEKDIERFLDEFADRDGVVDYSRYDLNGDGRTGGDEATYFNLDVDPAIIYNKVTQEIETDTVEFDENKVTDIEGLCYYAYSPMFSKDADKEKRRELLSAHCRPITLMIQSKYSWNGFFLGLTDSIVDPWEDWFVHDQSPKIPAPLFEFDPCARGGLPLDDAASFPSGVSAYGSSANTNLTITHSVKKVRLEFNGFAHAVPVKYMEGHDLASGSSRNSVRIDDQNGLLTVINFSDEDMRLVISWNIDVAPGPCPVFSTDGLYDSYNGCSNGCFGGFSIYKYEPCLTGDASHTQTDHHTIFEFWETTRSSADGSTSVWSSGNPAGTYSIDIPPGRHQFSVGYGEAFADCRSRLRVSDRSLSGIVGELEAQNSFSGVIEFHLEPM